jgi:hypothetical protein
MAGRAHSRTAQSALRSVFNVLFDSRAQRSARGQAAGLSDQAVHTRERRTRPGRVVRLRGRSRDRSTAVSRQRYRSMPAMVVETATLRQLLFGSAHAHEHARADPRAAAQRIAIRAPGSSGRSSSGRCRRRCSSGRSRSAP